MKISDLVKMLESKKQDDEVEFIVLKTNGEIVVCDVSHQAKSIAKVMKLFSK